MGTPRRLLRAGDGGTAMRRIRALIAGAALLTLLLPASAQAGSLTRESDTRVNLFCEELTAGNARLFMFSETSDTFGSFTDLAIWSGSMSGEPDFVSDTSTIVLTPTGGSGSVALVELNGDPAGTATLSAAFAPSGPAEPYEFTDQNGNQTFHIEGVFQPLSVTGTLTVNLAHGPDPTFALGSCFAGIDTFTLTNTNPATFVSGDQVIDLNCAWQLDDGFVQLFAVSDRFGTFSDLFIVDRRNDYFGFAEPVLSATSFVAEYEVFEGESGDPAGTASASATLTRTDERISIRDRSGNFKFNATGWVLAVDGSLTIDAGRLSTTLPMDDSTCSASDVRVQQIIGKTSGPKLKNDAPAGAIPLEIGDVVEVKTGGTAFDAEEPCTFEFDGNPEPLPFAHTAWWTFTGTGGDVTIDTAGSDFDTIVGVYILDGDVFEQVGCVDDVFDPETGEASLQSRITVATIAGQTYYIQTGGFGDSAGTLMLRLE
jgi:hypothetical protein